MAHNCPKPWPCQLGRQPDDYVQKILDWPSLVICDGPQLQDPFITQCECEEGADDGIGS